MKLRALSLTLVLTACYGDVCEEFFDGNCPGNGGTGGVGATGGTGGVGADGGTGGNMGGTGGTGGDGGTGGSGPGCIIAEGMEIGSHCGVFVGVTPGAGELGTKSNPYLSLPEALADMTSTGDIYVCNEFQETGAFTIPDGVRIIGKLACGTYAYDQASTGPLFNGMMDSPVFRVEGDATLFGVRANAAAGMGSGASSIGVLVTTGTLRLTESAVTAAAGNAGDNGDPPAVAMAPSGSMGMPGTNGCAGSGNKDGGVGGTVIGCSVSTQAGNGGSGGDGLDSTMGQDGTNGGPNGTGGSGGVKQNGASPCGDGMASTVMPVDGGDGTAVSALGSLSDTSPFYALPAPEQAGEGLSGRGGGGGGGGRQCASGNAGPGGGGGGAGGCGGLGGNSGASGGASFGIVLLGSSELELTDSLITASGGGAGGDGAPGQLGGSAGGPGANGTGNANGVACDGGPGIDGGNGGPGAAGPGGPSAAIVREFAAQVVMLNETGNTLDHGTSAAAGTPAAGGLTGMSGLTCAAEEVLSFDIADCE